MNAPRLAMVTLALGALAAFAPACGASEPHATTVAPRRANDAGIAVAEPAPAPPSYVLGDIASRTFAAVPLDRADVLGVIHDGLRVVSTGGGTRGAREVTDPPLVAAERVPRWLGGGFLFRSTTALYLADAFDGALRPLVTLPSGIERVSFGPKFALVRASSGERWAIELPSGKRVAASPTELADVAAVERRAAALTDAGAVLVSTDGGEKWSDVSAQLRGRAERVAVLEDAVWIVEASGAALRVDEGRVSSFDRAPSPKPVELRPRDPRWRAEEPPIRRAIRLGTPLDERTAFVVSEGDAVRVDVSSGEIVGVTPGKLPPDATCEAVRSEGEILVACTRPNVPGAFVASRAFGDKALAIEQTFTAAGQLYAGDDGALAFGGPCTRPKASRQIVCVRAAGGTWQEFDLEGAVADAGVGVDVVRWVPRPDGSAVGFVAGTQPALLDARSGELRPWRTDAMPAPARAALSDGRRAAHGGRVLDRTWSVSASGGLRGWTDAGAAIDVSPEGAITVSPFAFDRAVTSGRFAFARTREGRVWQTTDRGASWSEVAPPPTSQTGRGVPEPRVCSAVGCDLGTWYRVGWPEVPPAAAAAPSVTNPPERLPRASLPVVTCRRAGEAKTVAIARSDASPDDLGLGASTLATSADNGTLEVVRIAVGRLALVPPHGGTDARDTDYGAPRLVVHGPQTEEAGDDHFVVLAPNKDPMALRRSVAFVLPFDPKASLRRTQVGTLDAVTAARALGLRAADALRDDMTALASVAVVTPLDPAAPSDLLASSPLGLLTVLRAGSAPRGRVALRVRAEGDAIPLSAAQTGPDEIAVLEVEPTGRGVVFKVAASGVSDLFEVPAPPRAGLYPANAVAVGPKGELATLRTPSGADPPSALDPAVLTIAGAPTAALAPWSTLRAADSPECRADAGGFRATVAALRPWVKLAGDARGEEDAPMFARVRWSATRVCLEALELRAGDTDVKVSVRGGRRDQGPPTAEAPIDAQIETWMVMRFAGAPEAAKVAIVPGIELRQPMTCTLGP
jgi:hypothetical protein